MKDIGLEDSRFDAGGLGRLLRVFRLPDALPSKQFRFTQEVALNAGQTNPIYVRVTQYDGHQAWSSPIYVSCE